MKRLGILIILTFCLLSCVKETTTPQNEIPEGTPVSFNISIVETKSIKTSWANGDKIYVFFKGLEAKYLVLEYNKGNWACSSGGGTLLDSDINALEDRTITSVHFPVPVDVNYANNEFSFTVNGKPLYYYYLFEENKSYTWDGTTVSASISLEKPANMALFEIANLQYASDYSFTCCYSRPVACKSIGTDGAVHEDVLQANARVNGIAGPYGGMFAGRLTNPDETMEAYLFSVVSDAKKYITVRRLAALSGGNMYSFAPVFEAEYNYDVLSGWTKASLPTVVDLGLSVKWATEDVGSYISWGELGSKNTAIQNSYVFGTGKSITKYTGSDYTFLQKEDDVAFAEYGGKYRMPTEAEWQELIDTRNNYDYEWKWIHSDDPGSGSAIGLQIRNKKTNASLYLGASGYRWGQELDGYNSIGYYWTTSLDTNNPDKAKYVTIQQDSYSTARISISSTNRYYALRVRPVYGD